MLFLAGGCYEQHYYEQYFRWLLVDKCICLGMYLIYKETKYLVLTETDRNFPKVVKQSDTWSYGVLQFQLAYLTSAAAGDLN